MSFLLFPSLILIYILIVESSELFFVINAAAFIGVSFYFCLKFGRQVNKEQDLQEVESLTEIIN